MTHIPVTKHKAKLLVGKYLKDYEIKRTAKLEPLYIEYEKTKNIHKEKISKVLVL